MTEHNESEPKLFIPLIFRFEESNSFTLPSICLKPIGERIFSLSGKLFKESFNPYDKNKPWLAYEIDKTGELIENGITFDVRINRIYRLFPPFTPD